MAELVVSEIQALERIIDQGLELLAQVAVLVREALQVNDQNVGQLPEIELLGSLNVLAAEVAVPEVVLAELLLGVEQLEAARQAHLGELVVFVIRSSATCVLLKLLREWVYCECEWVEGEGERERERERERESKHVHLQH